MSSIPTLRDKPPTPALRDQFLNRISLSLSVRQARLLPARTEKDDKKISTGTKIATEAMATAKRRPITESLTAETKEDKEEPELDPKTAPPPEAGIGYGPARARRKQDENSTRRKEDKFLLRGLTAAAVTGGVRGGPKSEWAAAAKRAAIAGGSDSNNTNEQQYEEEEQKGRTSRVRKKRKVEETTSHSTAPPTSTDSPRISS